MVFLNFLEGPLSEMHVSVNNHNLFTETPVIVDLPRKENTSYPLFTKLENRS